MTVQDLIDELNALPSTAKMLKLKFSIPSGYGMYDIKKVIPNSSLFGDPIVEIELKENRNDGK